MKTTLTWLFALAAVWLMCHEAWLNGYRAGLRLGMGDGLKTIQFLESYDPHKK